jgi:hypothetical protein
MQLTHEQQSKIRHSILANAAGQLFSDISPEIFKLLPKQLSIRNDFKKLVAKLEADKAFNSEPKNLELGKEYFNSLLDCTMAILNGNPNAFSSVIAVLNGLVNGDLRIITDGLMAELDSVKHDTEIMVVDKALQPFRVVDSGTFPRTMEQMVALPGQTYVISPDGEQWYLLEWPA